MAISIMATEGVLSGKGRSVVQRDLWCLSLQHFFEKLHLSNICVFKSFTGSQAICVKNTSFCYHEEFETDLFVLKPYPCRILFSRRSIDDNTYVGFAHLMNSDSHIHKSL